MYQNLDTNDIEHAIQLISLSDHQYEKRRSLANKEVAICSKQTRLVCDVCTKKITKNLDLDRLTHFPDGIPVCCDIIWNQTICPQHIHDGTPICCGCMRLKTSDVTYVNLRDGREICLDCYPSAVFDVQQCDPLIIERKEFFRTLKMDLPDGIRVFLVDTEEMDRICDKEEPAGMIFGFSFKQEDMGTIRGVTSCSPKENSIVVEQHDDDEYRTGIAVLFGLPKIVTQAILTHEMMHVWFRWKGIESGELEQKLEEGMCQAIGWRWLDWLESEINSSSSASSTDHEQAQFLGKLVEACKFVVKEHDSYEYGQGFRDVQYAVDRFGLETTINHIITRGKLPN